MSQTPTHLILRNRANSQSSTGPRTAEGKILSRRNALRHGLTANPAAGVSEDPEVFHRLHRAVIERIQPRDVIEDGLVHRIAACLWRQQRAIRAETAIAERADAAVVPMRAEIQSWMEGFLDAWKLELHEFPADVAPTATRSRRPPLHQYVRPGLHGLDRRIEVEFMASGVGITALIELLVDLNDRLERDPCRFGRNQCEQLGCLLGERTSMYPRTDETSWPGQYRLTRVLGLIARATTREKGEPVPEGLIRLIRHRIQVLEHLRQVCEVPYDLRHRDRQRAAALLPDGLTVDRLLKYETHADRTLTRSLENLARLRGVTIERLSASVSDGGLKSYGHCRRSEQLRIAAAERTIG